MLRQPLNLRLPNARAIATVVVALSGLVAAGGDVVDGVVLGVGTLLLGGWLVLRLLAVDVVLLPRVGASASTPSAEQAVSPPRLRLVHPPDG